MELTDRLHLVGSGLVGLSLTDEYDYNVYLVDGGDELALVDTGAGCRADLTYETIADAGYDLASVSRTLLTHKQADHAGGTAATVRETGAEVVGTAVTAEALADPDGFNRRLERARRSAAYPHEYMLEGVTVDRVVRGGDTVAVGDLCLRVIETPGHCAGHCSCELVVDDTVVVFAGDAVLPFGEIVLQPIPDCSVEALTETDADMLLAGHLAPVLRDAGRHIGFAIDCVAKGLVPDELAIPGR